MLLIDEDAALAAIPTMLPDDAGARRQALDILKRVLTAAGPIEGEDAGAAGADRAAVRFGR